MQGTSKHTVKVSPLRTARSAAVSLGAPQTPGSTSFSANRVGRSWCFCLLCRGPKGTELTRCLQQQKPYKSNRAKRACRWPRHSCKHRQAEAYEA